MTMMLQGHNWYEAQVGYSQLLILIVYPYHLYTGLGHA